MKILLVAVNAKYIHSNLAVYSLRAYAGKELAEYMEGDCPELTIKIVTFTINQYPEGIREAIYLEHPDVMALRGTVYGLAKP